MGNPVRAWEKVNSRRFDVPKPVDAEVDAAILGALRVAAKLNVLGVSSAELDRQEIADSLHMVNPDWLRWPRNPHSWLNRRLGKLAAAGRIVRTEYKPRGCYRVVTYKLREE